MDISKATRLTQLSHIVPVPPFFVVKKGCVRKDELNDRMKYMVRSFHHDEDQERFSHAGKYQTIGPICAGEVDEVMRNILGNSLAEGVIVQEYVQQDVCGVAFCFSESEMLVEYSSVFEGVTSGTVRPFVALLPNSIDRYSKLQILLQRITQEFGPCDVEFVGLQASQFVQVRPITRTIEYDKNMILTQMLLQEERSTAWIENDVCRVLAERSHISRALIEAYLKGIQGMYKKMFNREIDVPAKPFIRISGQFFMAQSLHDQLILRLWESMIVSFKFSFIFQNIQQAVKSSSDVVELMRYSVFMSLAYDILKRQECFEWREKLRMKIESLLKEGEYDIDFEIDEPLEKNIRFDADKKVWESFSVRSGSGTVVVAGDVSAGPFYRLRTISDEIPKNVVLLTEHLYPEIGESLRDLKGIICAHGALTSHIAILAREYKIPLIIQADLTRYEE